jgi:hypothetical protein
MLINIEINNTSCPDYRVTCNIYDWYCMTHADPPIPSRTDYDVSMINLKRSLHTYKIT